MKHILIAKCASQDRGHEEVLKNTKDMIGADKYVLIHMEVYIAD
jgi:hypothetical protein